MTIKENLSSNEVVKHLSLPVSGRRVRQILHDEKGLRYKKNPKAPRLKPHHKVARLNFAEKYRFWSQEWKYVAFSDEKKFNLDGPDGISRSWQEKGREAQQRHNRNFGGGSVMVWAAFCSSGRTPICFISTKMNSVKYVELLENVLIPFADDCMDDNMIFQQDNAAIHRSKVTSEFLADRNISQFDFPAISPDLNPIENVWALLSGKVFKHGRQFDTACDLKKTIVKEWNNLDPDQLNSYIESMPRRLGEVIKNKGGATHY